MPMGRIDYVLSQYDVVAKQVIDFIVLEVMACSTTYTGDVLKSLHDILNSRQTGGRLRYGINFRQVISRMMIQVLAKAYACQKWQKRMVWAIQDVLYEYMKLTTKVELESYELSDLQRIPPDLSYCFFVYGMSQSDDMFDLDLKKVYAGAMESFTRIFEPVEIPEVSTLVEVLKSRIKGNESAYALSSLSSGLATIAKKIVDDERNKATSSGV